MPHQPLELNMKICDILEENKLCKICGLKNELHFKKFTDIHPSSKKRTKERSFSKFEFKKTDDHISITEVGPFSIMLSTEQINLNTNEYSVWAVENYTLSYSTLRLKFACTTRSEPDTKTDMDYKLYIKEDESSFDDGIRHYEIVYHIQINQITKEIINISKFSELMENNEFFMDKNFEENTTNIIKKEKRIILPFVYDRNLNDFDFAKLFQNNSLLK